MWEAAQEWVQHVGDWASGNRFALINVGLLLVGGWIVAKWAAGRVRRLGHRFKRLGEPYGRLAGELVRYAVLSGVIVTALAIIGVPTAGMVALLLGFLLVAAVSAHGALRNVVAGVLVQTGGPIKVGDVIETDGQTGSVIEIGLLTTSLRSEDGVFISIPNSRLSGRVVRNYTRLATRRLEVSIVVGYDQDIDEVIAICRDLLEANGRVLREPPAEVVVASLRETSVAITVRAWTSAPVHADAVFQLNRDLKKALEAAGVHLAPMAPRLPTPTVEPPAYISTAFRSRVRSRAIEP